MTILSFFSLYCCLWGEIRQRLKLNPRVKIFWKERGTGERKLFCKKGFLSPAYKTILTKYYLINVVERIENKVGLIGRSCGIYVRGLRLSR